jgi:hypothetical protein
MKSLTNARENSRDELGRRAFVKRAAQSLLGVGLLPDWMEGTASAAGNPELISPHVATAKRVIYLYMSGGQSHLDTWDPKESRKVAGPVKPIATSVEGLRVGEYLPLSAKRMQHVAVIRSMTSNQGAHEQGDYFMHTSYAPRGTIRHPGMGAWLDVFQPGVGHSTLPNYVYVGSKSRHPGAGFFPAVHQPLFVNNPETGIKNVKRPEGLAEDRLGKRLALSADLDREFIEAFPHRKVKAYAEMYDGAIRMMKSADLAAFDLTQEDVVLRKAYGSDPFGQGCLLARRLVERGVRFVEVSLGGWDTHSANFVTIPDLCSTFDRAFATLVDDLHQRGLLEDTLVVVATEFGRTPDINMNVGRDHYPQAFSVAMAGGGVRGGLVIGETDAEGREIAGEPIEIPSLNATIAYALGLPLEQTVFSPEKRPFTVADKGRPIREVFA